MNEKLSYYINKLAKKSGIDDNASFDNKLDLLIAMDLLPVKKTDAEVTISDTAEKTYNKIIDEQFSSPLANVSVLRENRQNSIEIIVPVGMENELISWTITEENGKQHLGQTKIQDTELAKEDDANPLRHTINGVTYERRLLKSPVKTDFGYHNIEITTPESKKKTASLIYCPQKCYDHLNVANGGKTWGVPVQLYEQKSEENQGIGDLSDLDEISFRLAKHGAGIVGVNPLHAMFHDKQEEASPYSPSSRTYFNHIYVDVTAIPEFEKSKQAKNLYDSPEYALKRRLTQRNAMVDYTTAMELKQPVMDACFDYFVKNELANKSSARGKDFLAFCSNGGERMHNFAVFQALSEFMSTKVTPKPQSFKDWPEEYQDPKSLVVKDFGQKYKHRVDFYKYMQWETDRQIANVQNTCLNNGMKIGLYTDLAVGSSPIGYEGWGCKDLFIKASAGAPADILSPNGQNWDILGFKPLALKKEAYKPFAEMLANNMKHAGCTRLDHVLQLARLYMIPEGKNAKEGAFVYYPVDDLMAIVALESHRNKTMTIGEDLGQLPNGFQEKLADHGILSYRVLPFEREWGYQNGGNNNAFKHPEEYPSYSTAAPSTHDTPPLASQWTAKHVHANDYLGYYKSQQQRNLEFEQYATEREALNWALTEKGCWEKVGGKPVQNPRSETSTVPEKFEEAVADYLGQSNSAIMLYPFSDMFRTNYMGNIPGTRQQHSSKNPNAEKDLEFGGASDIPWYNWRPKMHVKTDEIDAVPVFKNIAEILSKYRADGNTGHLIDKDYQRPGRNEAKTQKSGRIFDLYSKLSEKGFFKEISYEIIAAKFSEKHRQREIEKIRKAKEEHLQKRNAIKIQKEKWEKTRKETGQKIILHNKAQIYK